MIEGLENDLEKQKAMFRLTGLHLDQYRELSLACNGKLAKMNPARRIAMDGLITPNFLGTRAGIKLLLRTELLAKEGWYVGPRDSIEIAPDFITNVRILRQWTCGWLKASHMRALVEIYNAGCLSERYLAHVYGGRVVADLIGFGMVQPSGSLGVKGWEIYLLSAAGHKLIQDLELLQDGKSLP